MKKTKNKALYEDGDDAHFDGNPAYKRGKKRIAGSSKGHPAVRVTKKKATARKRVAGK